MSSGSPLRRAGRRLRNARVGHAEVARRAGCVIGNDCRILSAIGTPEPWLVTIGDRVTISFDVHILTHDGAAWLIRDESGRRYRYAPVHIGSDVFIGAGSIIMPGVRLGSRVIVGAGSVVTRSVPDGSVVAGNPARFVTSYASYVSKALAWPAAEDRRGTTYREQVDSIAETEFRPELPATGRESQSRP